ncbi:hypothetical protein Tco_0868330 [Tanacetum coccineum]
MVNLRALSPQSHDLKKMLKKPRPVKMVDESRSLSPRSTPNYMKSTISFEAKKEQSPKTTTPKVARKLKMDDLASGNKGSRMSSLKTQPVHDDGARSTPNYMKSTSSFEAKKEQSPKTTTPKVARKLKMDDLASGNKGSRTSSLKKVRTLTKTTNFMPAIVATEAPQKVDMEEENRDFFLEIYSKDRQEKGNQDLEGYCSALFSDDADDFCKEKNQKTGDDRLYSKLQQLYDGETLTSGARSEEDGDSESDGSYYKDHNFQNYDESEVSSTTTESDENDKMDEQGLDLLIGEKNIECGINYQHEKTSQESKTVPEFEKKSEDGNNKNHTTIIYNIIQYLCPRIQKPEHSEADKGVAGHVHVTSVAANETDTEELNEAMEEKSMNNEDDDAENITSFDEANAEALVQAELEQHVQKTKQRRII